MTGTAVSAVREGGLPERNRAKCGAIEVEWDVERFGARTA
jgi:hypothetical protein